MSSKIVIPPQRALLVTCEDQEHNVYLAAEVDYCGVKGGQIQIGYPKQAQSSYCSSIRSVKSAVTRLKKRTGIHLVIDDANVMGRVPGVQNFDVADLADNAEG